MNRMEWSRRDFLKVSALSAASLGLAPLGLAQAENQDRFVLGCYTRPWDDLPYEEALDAIAEAGFEGAGLMTTTGPSRLVISSSTTEDSATKAGEACRERGLKLLSVYGDDLGQYTSLETCEAGLRKLLQNCAAAKAPQVLLGGVGDVERHPIYYGAIRNCCDLAVELGVHMTLKPHGGTNTTGPQCRERVEEVDHPGFGLWYDPGNIYYYTDGALDPVDDVTTLDNLITGMCVKDYIPPKDVNVTPGDGKVDFPALMKVMRAGGFTGGPLVVECLKRGSQEERLAEARRAKAFLDELID